MPTTIFFSWQADTQTSVGRNLIDRSLNQVAALIGSDADVEEAVRDISIDRDTKDVPGSPPIVETIFRKIEKAAIFVPDLTFVADRLDGRRSPNPNVLIEYGWALKSLGHGRIIPVMNTAFGEPTAESMPFNLRHLRNPILYHCPAGAGDDVRRKARDELVRALEHALRLALESDEFKSSINKPAPPPPFQSRQPAHGSGRFRYLMEPIGVSDGFHGSAEVLLPETPVIWLRVMPCSDPGKKWLVTDITQAAKAPMIMPFSYTAGGLNFVRGSDGFGIYTPFHADQTQAGEVVFAFCSGEVWGVDAYALQASADAKEKFIPNFEVEMANALRDYSNFLVRLGIDPPFSWELGMEDTMGRALYSKFWSPIGRRSLCMAGQITATGSYAPGDSPRKALSPFFIALFDACGAEWRETN